MPIGMTTADLRALVEMRLPIVRITGDSRQGRTIRRYLGHHEEGEQESHQPTRSRSVVMCAV